MSNVEGHPRGQRLLPLLIEERAHRDPYKVFSSIPKSKSISDGYQDVSYSTVARAIDRAAWWLYDMTGKAPKGCKFAWLGPSDLRYAIFAVAAMKCRYQILIPSPRNSDAYQRQLFLSAGCDRLLCASVMLSKMKATLGDIVRQYVVAPELEELLDPAHVTRFPYDGTYEETKEEVCMILHTSGSTGPPKPINVTVAAILSSDMQVDLLDPDKRLWWRVFPGKRFVVGFPAYHAAGMGACLIFPVFYDYTPVYGLPGPLTAESAEAVHRGARVEGGFYPPFILDEMAQSASAIETIAKLDCVMFSGGPLAAITWERLSEVTHVKHIFGHTEGLAPAQFMVDKEYPACFHFHPAAGFKPEYLHDDLYKMVFRRSLKEEERQMPFYIFPDMDRFETGDLFSKHPTKPDLWLYRGRADDLVVLSTGEKFNPLPAEVKINTSPLVKRSLLAGTGRPHPVLFVQRDEEVTSGMTSNETITALWPLIEETNAIMATQGRLLKDYIVILPDSIEFALSSKGTIQRKASLDKLTVYINAMGSTPPGNDTVAVVETHDEAVRIVKEVLASLCGIHEVDENDNLFELGLDSAQAAQVSGRLREVASAWPRELRKGIAYLYTDPTVNGQAGRLLSPATNGTGSRQVDDVLSALVEKYTSGLESRERRLRRSDALTIVLTGSTGNIGSHLLNRLIDDQSVAKIVCLNRATTGEAAQRDAYARHRLQPLCPGKKTVQYLCVDLSESLLGLSSTEYQALQQEVDMVLHNAWELNFTHPVDSFEKTHIAGVRHLIDLCAKSKHDAHMVFLSSVGAVNGQQNCEPLITEESASPDHMPSDQGYSQSKAVAERILLSACDRGAVTGSIIRLGQIAGASGNEQGYWSTTDWAPRILASSKALGLIPQSLGPMGVVDWVPINAVPNILMEIVHTSIGSSTGSDCTVYHVANPRRVTWEDLAPTARHQLGEKARCVDFDEWLEHLIKAAYGGEVDREKLPATALLGWLETMSSPKVTPRYLSVDKTQAFSPTLAGLEPVNADMLQRWMREWGL